jgi:hypothetical protein
MLWDSGRLVGVNQRPNTGIEISGGVATKVGFPEDAVVCEEISVLGTEPDNRLPFCKTSTQGIKDPNTLPFKPDISIAVQSQKVK